MVGQVENPYRPGYKRVMIMLKPRGSVPIARAPILCKSYNRRYNADS